MSKSLPARPSLDHLRNQAKALLKACKGGRKAALSRIAAHVAALRGRLDVAKLLWERDEHAKECGDDAMVDLLKRYGATA